MDLKALRAKLEQYQKSDVFVTPHAGLQALVRNVDIETVKQNILNPARLVFAREQRAKTHGEKKYDCYFAFSRNLYHRYVLTTNGKVLIVTIIKINRDWQKAIG